MDCSSPTSRSSLLSSHLLFQIRRKNQISIRTVEENKKRGREERAIIVSFVCPSPFLPSCEKERAEKEKRRIEKRRRGQQVLLFCFHPLFLLRTSPLKSKEGSEGEERAPGGHGGEPAADLLFGRRAAAEADRMRR